MHHASNPDRQFAAAVAPIPFKLHIERSAFAGTDV